MNDRTTDDAGADLDAVADRLYREPPAAFTRARDRAVADARTAGDRGLARRIAALHRPTRSAWAVNQLPRADRERVLAVGAALRRAQETGAGTELRRLGSERHRLVTDLTGEAADRARRAGEPLGESQLREVERALRAVSTGTEAESFAAGRLLAAPQEGSPGLWPGAVSTTSEGPAPAQSATRAAGTRATATPAGSTGRPRRKPAGTGSAGTGARGTGSGGTDDRRAAAARARQEKAHEAAREAARALREARRARERTAAAAAAATAERAAAERDTAAARAALHGAEERLTVARKAEKQALAEQRRAVRRAEAAETAAVRAAAALPGSTRAPGDAAP